MSTLRRSAVLTLATLVAAWGTCAPASAQTATVVMTADNTNVALSDTFRLTIRCDTVGTGDAPDAVLPDLSAFDIVSQQVQRPMRWSMGWGGQAPTVQASSIYSFLLRPRREGRFPIAPAAVTVMGRTFRSNPLTITVGPGTGAPAPPPTSSVAPPSTGLSNPNAPAPTTTTDASQAVHAYTFDDRAFLGTVVDDREPFVGQQVTVTIYLYVRQQLSQWPGTTQEPTTDGFWTRDLLPPSRTPDFNIQVIQGVTFYAYVMRQVAAFPLREGDLTVGAMGVTIQQGSPFDILMGQVSPDLQRTGTPVTIHARALPAAGRPAGPAHVGTLALAATLDRAQTPTGDAVTLTVRATGTGRIDGLELDDLDVPGLRILAPHLETTVETPGGRVGGTRSFEWLIVPEQPGTFTIPSFHVAVLDPSTETWADVASQPLTLTAAGNALTDPTTAPRAVAQTDTPEADEASTPLGPVRTEAALVRHRTRIAAQPWFPYVLGMFPVGWALLVIARSARRRMAAREAAVPATQRVAREAKKRLATAEEKAAAGDARGFYSALTLAISAVIEGKLGESVGALTHRELSRRLIERGMDADLAKKIAAELEGADFARYSTSAAAKDEMQGALDRGREILSALERFTATQEDE